MKRALLTGLGIFLLIVLGLAIWLWLAGDGSIPMDYEGF